MGDCSFDVLFVICKCTVLIVVWNVDDKLSLLIKRHFDMYGDGLKHLIAIVYSESVENRSYQLGFTNWVWNPEFDSCITE